MKKQITFILTVYFITFLFASCKKDIDLTAPQSVAASSNLALKIIVNWNTVPGATNYKVYRSDYNEDTTKLNFKEIGNSESNSYEDIDVISESSYYYKVEATNGGTTGPRSTAALGETIVVTADEAFNMLAELTDGKRYNAASAAQVPSVMIQAIQENAKSGCDLVFLIDNTSSMSDDIAEVKKGLTNIISKLPSATNLGAATYNDNNVDLTGWYTSKNFTKTYSTITSYINSIIVYGGGDDPESVYDGLYETLNKMSWTATNKRMIIVVGDAPPLEGSLTKHTLSEVAKMCNSMSVKANLYPILIKS